MPGKDEHTNNIEKYKQTVGVYMSSTAPAR